MGVVARAGCAGTLPNAAGLEIAAERLREILRESRSLWKMRPAPGRRRSAASHTARVTRALRRDCRVQARDAPSAHADPAFLQVVMDARAAVAAAVAREQRADLVEQALVLHRVRALGTAAPGIVACPRYAKAPAAPRDTVRGALRVDERERITVRHFASMNG